MWDSDSAMCDSDSDICDFDPAISDFDPACRDSNPAVPCNHVLDVCVPGKQLVVTARYLCGCYGLLEVVKCRMLLYTAVVSLWCCCTPPYAAVCCCMLLLD